MNNENKKLLLQVEFDETDGCYDVTIPEGSSALETVFCMAVITKLFERDNIMTREEILENYKRYLNDKQYDEVIS